MMQAAEDRTRLDRTDLRQLDIPGLGAVFLEPQISWSSIPRKRLNNLLAGPSRRRRLSDVEVDDPPPCVVQDEEDVQHPERCRR